LGLLGLLIGCGGDGGDDRVDTEVRIPSEGMLPIYAPGDTLEVDLEPDSVGRGDVVIFFPPEGAERAVCGAQHSIRSACPRPTRGRSETRFAKRIVGMPGERLKIVGGAVYIDGERQAEAYATLGETCPICNLPVEITIRRATCSCWATTEERARTAESGGLHQAAGSSARSSA
jgi:hypothetical protein